MLLFVHALKNQTKISTLPLSFFVSAFQKSSVYSLLLVFHILPEETEAAGVCACVLTQLSFFSKSLLWYTQWSHFIRSKVFGQRYRGLPIAAEEAGKSKQDSLCQLSVKWGAVSTSGCSSDRYNSQKRCADSRGLFLYVF